MKRKTYQISATFVLVIVAFLCAIFFANPNSSFAASGKNKSSSVDRLSAVEHTELQIKQLQGTLKITGEQEELWNKLTTVMRENAKDMDAFTKERAEDAKSMNSVEHMKLHRQITEEHLAQLKKLIPPFEAFYNSMSDQQKNITDMVFRTGKYGKSKKK
jgi:hypothetical protein